MFIYFSIMEKFTLKTGDYLLSLTQKKSTDLANEVNLK